MAVLNGGKFDRDLSKDTPGYTGPMWGAAKARVKATTLSDLKRCRGLLFLLTVLL